MGAQEWSIKPPKEIDPWQKVLGIGIINQPEVTAQEDGNLLVS